jgi:lipopolysaccharide export system protein LptA
MERRKAGMSRRSGIGFLILGILFFHFLILGEAQEKKGISKEPKMDGGFGFTASKAPIDIESETVEANQKQNTVTFKGNVVAKQEDITLYANTLVITYDGNTKKLKEIMAVGNVKIVQLERRATSQKATFDQEENKVILDGEAVVREGENVIRGERVIFYVDEERSFVEGKKGGRVSTSITPSSKDGRESKKAKAEDKK